MRKQILLLLFLLLFTTELTAQNQLPDLKIKTLNDKEVNIKKKTEKGTYLINFWATWCIPCINELELLSDVYDEWGDELNIKIIAVSIDDSRTLSKVAPLVNGKGWEFDILSDSNHDLKRALNISGIPYTIIVKNGKIRYKNTGYTPGYEDTIYQILKNIISDL
jgi:thiol-disulfide isomerase/thioredoxin